MQCTSSVPPENPFPTISYTKFDIQISGRRTISSKLKPFSAIQNTKGNKKEIIHLMVSNNSFRNYQHIEQQPISKRSNIIQQNAVQRKKPTCFSKLQTTKTFRERNRTELDAAGRRCSNGGAAAGADDISAHQIQDQAPQLPDLQPKPPDSIKKPLKSNLI